MNEGIKPFYPFRDKRLLVKQKAIQKLDQSRSYDLSWAFQAFLSLLGLIVLSPVFLVISLLIKLTDRGPVFYRGERVGLGGRLFKIYKFRTLIEGAEEKIGGRLLSKEDQDVYYTGVGSFLKRSKLDELPQLLNVIRGEMRLAGPRPIRPIFLDELQQEIPNYMFRHLVPPGITGIAQLRGGYYTSALNKLRYDLIYVKNRSLLLDLKLVLLTFVKILNHWLSMGFFILFLFLFVSFLPSSLHLSIYIAALGTKVKLLYLFIILLAAWVFAKKDPEQFTFYRCPLNLPTLLFVLLSAVAVFFADNPEYSLRRAGYFVVTGFLVSLIIVNNRLTMGFVTLMVRVIALTSVLISLYGLFQIFLFNDTPLPASASLPNAALLAGYTRLSSILGSPIVVSVYLVLGIPLLLSELRRATSQRARDFWLVCSTISFVGIFFTQTRVGLLALLVTGTVFLCRRLSHALSFFAIFLLCFLFLSSLGVPRFALSRVGGEVSQWVQETTTILRTISAKQWLLGAGEKESPEVEGTGKRFQIQNTHVTLMLEYGIARWLLIMQLIVSSLLAMKLVHERTKDDRLKAVLWAIISSILGFLISMNGMNALHNLTLQIFFWCLLGIGLGIVIQLNGHRRENLIWQFGDAGDW
jgi:lipopolysaccharide/colanic/teichoic acid biosynthesis glycosyltransferase